MIRAEDNITLKSTKSIYDTAQSAQQIAGNTNQYFWQTSTGTDTGAHITEKTQEQFLADPANGGANLLARSNGLAVRDGLTELATFGADEVQIGKSFGTTFAGVSITPSSLKFNPRYYQSSFRYEIVSADTQVTQRVVGSGARIDVGILRWKAGTTLTVTIDGVTTTNYHTAFPNNGSKIGGLSFDTTPYPAEGSVIVITYTVDSYDAYQFGIGTVTAPYGIVEGLSCRAEGFTAHAEGNVSVASGSYSHAQNYNTIASGSAQTAMGRWNTEDANNALIIGNGTSATTRSDALAVTWEGDILLADDTDISALLTTLGW